MIPDPIPVAVPDPKRPVFVAIWEVRVTTESFARATTAVMSSCCTVVVPPLGCAATLAFGVGAAAGDTVACGNVSSTIAKVDPDASRAARTAAPRTLPARRGLRSGSAATGIAAGGAATSQRVRPGSAGAGHGAALGAADPVGRGQLSVGRDDGSRVV